jgi:glycine cleavage system H lipoate-binding protein/ABC-type phosphate transport system substrate-binding protein
LASILSAEASNIILLNPITMKSRSILITGLSLLLFCGYISCSRDISKDPQSENSFTILSTPDLNELANTWANSYVKLNPELEIKVSDVPENSMVESIGNSNGLVMMAGEYGSEITAGSSWKEVIGRDVIVPVFNSDNPLIADISRQGISYGNLVRLIKNPETVTWGTILETEPNIALTLYVLEDPSMRSAFGSLLNVNQVNIKGKKVGNGLDFIAAIQEDPYAIGLCKMPDIVNSRSQKMHDQIALLPIDRNENGQIDYDENIYGDLDAFTRGVWIGKYPRVLSRNIYFVSSSQPENKSEVAFIKWTLTDGQVMLDNHGFADLDPTERAAKVRLIDVYDINTAGNINGDIQKAPLFHNILFLGLLVFLALVLIVTISGILVREKEPYKIAEKRPGQRSVLNEGLVESPPGLYFDLSHTWAFMEKDGMVRVGIDDFLQHITGPLTRIKMKQTGEKIRKGSKVISIIQDGKQLDINSPISGTIREKNTALSTNTSLINSSPYSEGWIYRLEPSNWIKDIRFMFTETKYREWLKHEFTRLKEFLINSVRSESPEYSYVLQDGGELQDCILENLGPEIWEEFQTNFMDVPS